MAAPYWGNLDPPAVTRQNSVRKSGNGTGRDSMQSQPASQQTQSNPNRISAQSQAPTVSTQSPFASPTDSSFQAEGLTPRPPSFPYGAVEAGNRDYLERRRRRASRDTEEYYDNNRDSGPPPAAPDAPRPAPPLSYKQPYNIVGPSASYSAPTRSRSTRRPEGPVDANQSSPSNYYQERRSDAINDHHHTDHKKLNTGGEYERDKATTRGYSDDPIKSTSRGSVGARRENPDFYNSEVPRPKKDSMIETETQRRRDWAPDKSPLQRLELTLDSITKGEKRARVQEAEMLVSETRAGRGGDRVNQNSVRFRDRPIIKGPEKGTQPEPQSLRDVDLMRSLSSKQKGELQRSGAVEKKKLAVIDSDPARQLGKGFEYQPLREVTGTGTAPIDMQRGLSFREHAAVHATPSATAVPKHIASEGIIRSISNKLKKDPPGDPWFNRRLEAEIASQHAASRRQPADTRREPSQAGGPLNSAPVITQPRGAVTDSTPEKRRYNSSPSEDVGSNSDEFSAHVSVRKNSSKKMEQLSRLVSPDSAEGNCSEDTTARGLDKYPHLSDPINLSHHRRSQYRPGAGIYAPSQRLDEWKSGGVAALTGALLDLEVKQIALDKDRAWWEANRTGKQKPGASKQVNLGSYDGGSENSNGIVFPDISQSMIEDEGSSVPSCLGTSLENNESIRPFPERCTSVEETSRSEMKLQGEKSSFRRRLVPVWSNQGALSSGALSFLHASSLPYSSNHRKISKHNIFQPFHTLSITPKSKSVSKKLTNSMRSTRVGSTTGQTQFEPPLYLKCGPLLRYCGIRQEGSNIPGQSVATINREIWRGSVMIVTLDSRSSYESAPIIRLFSQPMDLLPPPPAQVGGAAGELAPEYVDPIAGLTKVFRDGRTLFVRPVEQLAEERDLSGRDDFDDGLFEAQQSIPGQAPSTDRKGPFTGRSRKDGIDGERLGKCAEVEGFRLHVEQEATFWRFNIEVELQSQQQRIAYRINQGPISSFWVPAQGQSMNIMFHSCNGFSLGVNTDQFSGPDPMWRDVLNTHQTQPFHVMIGGGDQIYNDLIMEQTELFKEWLNVKNPLQKQNAPFTTEMQDELEAFYFERYAKWFSQGLFGIANSQIPMVNIFDDHDIIDGFGSYPHHFMDSPVFTGLGAVAFKYYMLFQHQSIIDEGEETEPSWILGLRPGPYIKELSRSVFMFMGMNIAFLGLDCRTERSHEDVVSDETYSRIFNRLHHEIVKGHTKHLIVLLSVPVAYPRLVWLENILTSRLMDPIKAVGKSGIFGKLLNQFDGGVEIIDDLDDHWTAKNHKAERNWLIEELQELAAEKSMRVTILGGDVHLAAVGQFYSAPKLGIPKDQDHRYMPNVISSAIANAPPPDMMADILNKRNKVHHLNHKTDESMIPMFVQDVNGSKRNNKHLMPKRNWCSIRECMPDITPPPTPSDERSLNPTRRKGLFRRFSASRGSSYRVDVGPPVSMSMHNFSLTRGRPSLDSGRPKTRRSLSLSRRDFIPANLFRRGSKRRPDDGGINGYGAESDEDKSLDQQADLPKLRGGAREGSYYPENIDTPKRKRIGRNFVSGNDDEYTNFDDNPRQNKFPHQPSQHQSRYKNQPQVGQEDVQEQEPMRKPFHRVPTSLCEGGRRKGGPNQEINLEGGLDICLNVEVNQKDPTGITVPYRLLVPALWYEDKEPSNHYGSREWKGSGLMRLMSFRRGGGPSNASWKGKEREGASIEDNRDV